MSEDKNIKNENSKAQVLKGEESLLLDHNYDGIQELDHALPRWWLWILYGTIIFSAWYVGYYMSGMGPNQSQELEAEMARIALLKSAAASTPERNEDTLLAAVKDPTRVKHGQEVFSGKCAACHGDKAQGVIGPNLTDDYWIHGNGTLKDIAQVVTDGVADKGMPPWGAILTDIELKDVVAFVHSVHDSHPAGAKEPQGEKKEDED